MASDKWATEREFLRLAFRPLPNAQGWVSLGTAVLALFGVTVGPGLVGAWPAGAVGFLFGVIMLLGWAGYRLQRDKEERGRSKFSLAAYTEPIHDGHQRDGVGPTFEDRTLLWVDVENSGVEAEFASRFLNIRGAQKFQASGSVSNYSHPVAWEDTGDRKMKIGYLNRARLLVAWSFRHPPTFWFVTPGTAAWAPGQAHQHGWVLQPADPGGVAFDLQVVNETERKAITKRARIEFGDDGSVAVFTLSDAGELIP
jgi:hypothetical protein